jgi:hypothetical protein
MQGYVIHVGHIPPTKAIIAFPDKDTKQPTGNPIEVMKTVGSFQMVNRARVWGRRVLPDGKVPVKNGVEQPIEVLDREYKGHLQFFDWGSDKAGAMAIEIRYLRSSSSLDYEYQINVQKIITRPEDGSDMIVLTPGENKFDLTKDALFIQFLKVYPENFHSKSKNPDAMIKGYTYKEVSDGDVDKTYIRNKEAALDMGIFVKQLSAIDGGVRNVFDILSKYGWDFGNVNELSVDTDIYTALLRFSEFNPDDFSKQIDRFKKEVQDRFAYAKSFNALDTTKSGYIALRVNGQSDIVWEGVDGKGDNMLDWVIENFAENKVYHGIRKFISLCNKLK